MRRRWLLLLATIAPSPALAHDAFGDLGPFYASLLHPLADPLQGALVIGTAAVLAGRETGTVRLALPVFMAAAVLGLGLAWRPGVVPTPLLTAAVAVAVGLTATVPARWLPLWVVLPLVAVSGALAGLAPGRPDGAALQSLLGGVLGIGIFATLAWAGLDALARRVTPLASAVAGAWVAAVGILAGAFTLQPATAGDAAARLGSAPGEAGGPKR
jgi:hypothetical protein